MGRTALDPRWSKQSGQPAYGFMTAGIKIVRKNPGGTNVYDQQTRTWSGSYTVVFEGKGRVQPYGIIGDELLAQDPTGKRLMRVQLKEKNTGINLDDHLQVVDCANNRELELFDFTVRGTIGSNLEWLTDLVVEANLKHA